MISSSLSGRSAATPAPRKGTGVKIGCLVLGRSVELIPAGGALDAGGILLRRGAGREREGKQGYQHIGDQLLHHFTSFHHQLCTIGFVVAKAQTNQIKQFYAFQQWCQFTFKGKNDIKYLKLLNLLGLI
jgi:hypothetical protein